MMHPMKHLTTTLLIACSVSLAACGSFSKTSDGIDYRSARKGNPLEIPPDLMRLSNDGRYNISGSTSAATYAQEQQALDRTAVAPVNQIGDVEIKRDGNQRWLVVNRPPKQLWDSIKAFWEDNGFVLALEDRRLGVMETDWAENRANIPMDPIRSTIGKLFDSLYSTGTLDRFRTRLEANQTGGTDIFISQRGMEEVYSARDKSTTSWQPSPNNPALEDEFLRRMMVALGVSKERAAAMVKQSQAGMQAAQNQQRAAVQYSENAHSLTLTDNFDRAWRRVGLSLDRSGFSVEDRDRSAGYYFVRYVPFVPAKKEKKGFIGRLFKRKAKPIQTVRYRVTVQNSGNGVVVRVQDTNGQAVNNHDSQRILQVLAKDLQRL